MNRVSKALAFVKAVDGAQALLDRAPHAEVARALAARIRGHAQLERLLDDFHGILAKIGINANSAHHNPTPRLVWLYRWAYATRLAQLHSVFWDECRQLDVAQRHHKLGFLPDRIGPLDPVYYGESSDKPKERRGMPATKNEE